MSFPVDKIYSQQEQGECEVTNDPFTSMPKSNVPSYRNHSSFNITSCLVTGDLVKSSKNIEQPKTKRQKIYKTKCAGGSKKAKSVPSTCTIDAKASTRLSAYSLSSAHSIILPSLMDNSFSNPCLSRASSFTELLDVQSLHHTLPLTDQNDHSPHYHTGTDIFPDNVTSTSSAVCQSSDEVDHNCSPDLTTGDHPSLTSASIPSSNKTLNSGYSNYATSFQQEQDYDLREFEDSLSKQCLCGRSDRMLMKPFQSHYSFDANGVKRPTKLSEWPSNKLLQFLSNLQLIFDIYFKQNSMGFICLGILDACQALIRDERNIIDEIMVLSSYRNGYVQYLAARVLASYFVIGRGKMKDNWLKKPVDNLFNFDHLDQTAIQNINFSLEIIKRIIEWKDTDSHSVEENFAATENISDAMPPPSAASVSNVNNSALIADEMNSGDLHFQSQQPTLESNYFAVHYRLRECLDEISPSSSLPPGLNINPTYNNFSNYNGRQHNPILLQQKTCHLIIISESFDTTHLKCKTIKFLERKWAALVENMTLLIKSHLDVENAENCVLNFLQLWEKIISVKANLPVGETQPFYTLLSIEFLLNHTLPCQIYKQMLCLYNEALCYGSTLAMQDILPKETLRLADEIVMRVKDVSISDYLPRRKFENLVNLIGFKGEPINYECKSLQHQFDCVTDESEKDRIKCVANKMDKTILQKFVLLVLKSIAVKFKVICFDSSDSSLDSADYDDFQDVELIALTSSVLRKLESFLKSILELLPHCHFSTIVINLFMDQDDHLIEAMICTLDVANRILVLNNALPELQTQYLQELMFMLNPVYTFLDFLKSIRYGSDVPLRLLVSNETCFLLYLLRFLKHIGKNLSSFQHFVSSCHNFDAFEGIHQQQESTLLDSMSLLICLRLKISHLVSRQLFPYNISPVLRLLENCESFYSANELV